MPEHLQKNTLLVVSDTAMMNENGQVLVFDPVLREMKVVEELFDKIIWLGARTLYKKPSLKPINSSKVQPIVMPCVSRPGFINILYVLYAYPVFLFHILKHLKHATHVHTRGPSHPAYIMILISLWDKKRIYAHKYAGEWTDENIPFTYKLQRNILKKVLQPNIRITVSGKNETDYPNVQDFENPSMYEDELHKMNEAGVKKDFAGSLKLLFVGNLMPSKGIIPLMQALQSNQLNDRFTEMHIVGGGKLIEEVRALAKNVHNLNIVITGHISREELNKLYAAAHFMILPSTSESFPKVVAEASAFGCIPVTTNLSAITKKITNSKNGFLMNNTSSGYILDTLNRIAGNKNLKQISTEAIAMSKLFTYERFKSRMAEVYNINQ